MHVRQEAVRAQHGNVALIKPDEHTVSNFVADDRGHAGGLLTFQRRGVVGHLALA